MKQFFKVINLLVFTGAVITLAKGAPTELTTENTDGPVANNITQAETSQSEVIRSDPPVNGIATSADGPSTNQPTAVNTFFDNIFNIPTSVLRAVNKFLNNNIKIGAQQSQSSKTIASAPSTVSASGNVQGTTSSTDRNAAVSDINQAKPAARDGFFDSIFNIPISALNSANTLITGRKF